LDRSESHSPACLASLAWGSTCEHFIGCEKCQKQSLK
jgi:hypothetical protein